VATGNALTDELGDRRTENYLVAVELAAQWSDL